MDRRTRHTIALFRRWGVRIWAGIMVVGLTVGLLFFARPATSILEKRELSPFPSFTVDSFLDGSFFTDLSLWYADTYPLREPMVGTAQGLGGLYGIQPNVKLVGGNIHADDIDASSSSSDADEKTDGAKKAEWAAVEAPEGKAIQEAMQEHLMAGLYIKNGAAYNIYYFVEDGATTYIEAMNSLASQLEGQAQVYSMLIPNGSAVLLDKSELDALGGSDQVQAIEYFYGRYSDAITPLDINAALGAHNDDYIFFRTDHHWTQLGAYYAYQVFCEAAGLEAADMLSWKQQQFSDFLGTFYTETGDGSLIADTVDAYTPPQTNDIHFTDQDGAEQDSNVIVDVSNWGQGTGYYCYGIGDYPLVHVANPQLSDGSACLLLKDSYGNCLAPQLIGHYQDLWVIDYRYSDTNIVEFVREHGINTVIVENNISIATTEQIAQALASQVKPSNND